MSATARLAYVLRHFGLAYPDAPAVRIGYAGAQPLAHVEIEAADNGFFAGQSPYPDVPNWRDWQGQRVPFFFDTYSEKPLLIFEKTSVFISADIISSAFYLLSGWQEYFSVERDRHGRFPYAASVQFNYDFVTLPVVNYYFDVLRVAVEHVGGRALAARRWGEQRARFAAFISHDVDRLRSAWKAPAKAALRGGKPGLFAKLFWQHLTRPDAWDNLEAVAAAVAGYGGRSTFFVLPSSQKSPNGIPNADYRLTVRLRERLRRLLAQGNRVALHGSLGTATNAARLRPEIATVAAITAADAPAPAAGGLRFHYLSWEPTRTPAVVQAAGVSFDSTLGFAEHFGFRNSYCHPFYPFNFSTGEPVDFLEIPLTVMDTTLHHSRYLQLDGAAVLAALRPVIEQIKKLGGVMTILWHNENFDPANLRNGPRQFHEIMTHLQQQGAAFLTGDDVCEELGR